MFYEQTIKNDLAAVYSTVLVLRGIPSKSRDYKFSFDWALCSKFQIYTFSMPIQREIKL